MNDFASSNELIRNGFSAFARHLNPCAQGEGSLFACLQAETTAENRNGDGAGSCSYARLLAEGDAFDQRVTTYAEALEAVYDPAKIDAGVVDDDAMQAGQALGLSRDDVAAQVAQARKTERSRIIGDVFNEWAMHPTKDGERSLYDKLARSRIAHAKEDPAVGRYADALAALHDVGVKAGGGPTPPELLQAEENAHRELTAAGKALGLDRRWEVEPQELEARHSADAGGAARRQPTLSEYERRDEAMMAACLKDPNAETTWRASFSSP